MPELPQYRALQAQIDIQLTTFQTDRSGGDEAHVINAALTHQDKGEVFVHEIATEVNRLLATRVNQGSKFEKVGH